MTSLREFQMAVASTRRDYQHRLVNDMYEEVAEPWFHNIFPVKSELYGVEGLFALGSLDSIGQIVGCYFRWERLTNSALSITSDSVQNALLDAFGYSVIMRVMSELEKGELNLITWGQHDKTKAPRKDIEKLISLYWQMAHAADQAANTIALRAAINMYRRTPGA
jgi:hypothetical protein